MGPAVPRISKGIRNPLLLGGAVVTVLLLLVVVLSLGRTGLVLHGAGHRIGRAGCCAMELDWDLDLNSD